MAHSKKVVVIGSGLSAFGAISALLEKNFDVQVIDVGKFLPPEVDSRVKKLRDVPLVERSDFFIENFLAEESLIGVKKKMPRKGLFGSYFFYEEEMINSTQSLPFSEAFGGYSVAWGAATLMPRMEDLRDLPFDFNDITEAAQALAQKFPIPYFEDSLTPFFPNLVTHSETAAIKLSHSQSFLKNCLSRLITTSGDAVCLVGQARVATFSTGINSCVYCGMCSSGCAFNSIFSTKQEISQLHEKGAIGYFPNRKVTRLIELNDRVQIIVNNLESNKMETLEADYVFVAAGTLNSTKIAIETFNVKNKKVNFLKTGNLVKGYFSLRKLGFDWPNQNTQANVFMESYNPNISEYWIHSQISTPNEIVIKKIGYLNKGSLAEIFKPLKKWFLSHLVLVMTNLHSSTGPFYEVEFSANEGKSAFRGELIHSKKVRKLESRVSRFLDRKLMRIGFLPLPFTKKGSANGFGYHLGGSMPMGGSGQMATDSLGRFEDSSRISFVDTSVLPSIPSTTIGFLAAANAYRIANAALLRD